MNVLHAGGISIAFLPILFVATNALATEEIVFRDLRKEVEALKPQMTKEKSAIVEEETKNVTGCEEKIPDDVHGEGSQYIYNAQYEWASIPTKSGRCIQLFRPFHRTLTADEAKDLLTASELEFPVGSPGVEPNAFDEPKLGRGYIPQVQFRSDGTMVEIPQQENRIGVDFPT